MDYLKKMARWLMKYKQVVGVAFGVLPFFAMTAYAQISTGIPPISDADAFHGIICNVFNDMFWVLMSVSIIMIMWAAYLYVTAGDNSEQPSEAKMAILYAIIGIVAALIAKGAPTLVASVFGAASSVKGC